MGGKAKTGDKTMILNNIPDVEVPTSPFGSSDVAFFRVSGHHRGMYKEDILGQELIGTLPKASQYLRKTFESILEPFGFGLVSYLILQRLWECDKQPMKELEDQMELSTSQLLIAIKELEAGSFTTREPNPADGRSRLVCLTERGARVQESAWRLNNQILDLLRKDRRLSTMDLHDLNRFCKLIVQVLETF